MTKLTETRGSLIEGRITSNLYAIFNKKKSHTLCLDAKPWYLYKLNSTNTLVFIENFKNKKDVLTSIDAHEIQRREDPDYLYRQMESGLITLEEYEHKLNKATNIVINDGGYAQC